MTIRMLEILLALLTILSNLSVLEAGLYDQNDAVTILDNSNFKGTVCNSTSAWMVEFYNSWCGHCIRFAPIWKEFAVDVTAWNRVIHIGAVDCAEKENIPLCRSYSIKAYPAIKLFGPFISETDVGEEYLDLREMEEMRQGIIQLIEKETQSKVPPGWPDLKPVHSTDVVKTSTAKFASLVVEKDHSFIGREVILDVSSIRNLAVYRISNKAVSDLGEVKNLPALYLYNRTSGSFVLKANGFKDRRIATDILKDFTGYEPGTSKPVTKQNENIPTTNRPLLQTRKKTKVYMKDLESALVYSLTQEISAHKIITGSALETLKNYTSVLAKYFPGKPKIFEFLKQLNNWVKVKTTLSGQQWMAFIENVQSEYPEFPTSVKWIGCQGSEKNYRGYPCSLWTLFHALTVNSVLEHGEEKSFSSMEVLSAMRGYIQYFFGCKECRKNFGSAAVKMEDDVHNPDDSIMWLWASHNRANFHLHGDGTEDPAHPKIQFPSNHTCPQCHVTHSAIDEEWNKSEVLKHLKQIYARQNIEMGDKEVDDSVKSGVYMQDIESAVIYSLTQELGLNNEFFGETYSALKEFIKVLYQYFPGDEKMKLFFEEILHWVNWRSEIKGEDWMAFIKKTQDKYPSVRTVIEWKACQGSLPQYRGYPCSLWTLFHTLTVNAYIKHEEGGTLGTYNPLEILEAMEEYIRHFFGCRECSKHFGKMAAELAIKVQDADESILWLWNAHNRANHRLHGDKTEDSANPKIQFPSKKDCPKCHVTNPTSNEEWDFKEVMSFLRQFYGKRNIIGWKPNEIEIEQRKANELLLPSFTNEVPNKKGKESLKKDKKYLLYKEKSSKNSEENALHYHEEHAPKGVAKDDKLERILKMRDVEWETRTSSKAVTNSWGFNSIDLSLCVVLYVVISLLCLIIYFHLTAHRRRRFPFKLCPV